MSEFRFSAHAGDAPEFAGLRAFLREEMLAAMAFDLAPGGEAVGAVEAGGKGESFEGSMFALAAGRECGADRGWKAGGLPWGQS